MNENNNSKAFFYRALGCLIWIVIGIILALLLLLVLLF